MRILLYFRDSLEFDRLHQDYFGRRPDLIQDFMVATAPGIGDRVGIFEIADDTALATWIRMARPHWIDYSWIAQQKYQQNQ